MQRLSNMKITSVDNVTTILSAKGRQYKTKERESYGISFCTSGKIVYYHNEKEIVSAPNRIVLLPKGASYSLTGTRSGEFPLINFNCETTTPISDFLFMDIENQDKYLKLFEKIKEYFLFGNNELKILKTLYELLDTMVTEYNQKNFPLMSVITYIEKNYSDSELTNTVLAGKLNISEVYMRRLFRNQFGTTPKQYILDIRLQQATQQLAETKKTVTDIAIDCGFSSLSHFSRAFKDKLGETPIEYRMRHDDMLLL